MQARDLMQHALDHGTWRRHAGALRRSGDLLWAEFGTVIESIRATEPPPQPPQQPAPEADPGPEHDLRLANEIRPALDALEAVHLMYGLALEAALKGWLATIAPDLVEFVVVTDAHGKARRVETLTAGMTGTRERDLLALANAAGLFDERFQSVIRRGDDRRLLRDLCREMDAAIGNPGRYVVALPPIGPRRRYRNISAWADALPHRRLLDVVLDRLVAPPA